MTYTRFKDLWTTMVSNRVPASEPTTKPLLHNGVSAETVAALVEVADGNHSKFDAIQARLAKNDVAAG